MKTLDETVLRALRDLSEGFCNDVKEGHDPERQMNILAGTMQPDLVEIYNGEEERERLPYRFKHQQS